MNTLYSFLRYFVALAVIQYGFAKLNGAMFTILQSELDKPLGGVSGFWLTWYYFGYSSIYGNFIALVQVVGGALLLFRKTTLLGTCILLPVIGNIILIDIFYAIDLGALLVAMILFACLLGIASFHKDELIAVFWSKQNSVFHEQRAGKGKRVLRLSVRVLVIALPAVYTYYLANYNNRLPTPIDGRWKVTNNPAQVSLAQEPLAYIYFERNRAFMCVFRYGASTWQTHHFELDNKTGQLDIWDTWLSKGEKIFSGKFGLTRNHLVIDGQFDHSGESVIELEKQE